MPNSSPVLAQTDAIGRYQVLRRLARGGMAEVLLARVTGIEGFEKLVVIKKILPQLTESREFVEMFLDEARVLAQLQHTNIAQVYDIGSTNGSYFMSMEFLHGQDLRALTRTLARRGGRLPLEHVLFIASSVCAGLHYAHEKIGRDGQPIGIVHRDISPHNVFVTYDGAVKLLDFGIAKTARRATHTRVGTLKGKLGYMSPEQCRSDRDLDRRADVYAIGVLMWEMLAGERLHQEESDFEIMKAICEEDARPPSKVRPCDPAVERAVMKALARDPDHRYQTAQELLEELEELARQQRLKQSANDLSLFVRGIFAQQIATWETAREEGKSLGEHMQDVTRADRYPSASGRGSGGSPASGVPSMNASGAPSGAMATGPSSGSRPASGRSYLTARADGDAATSPGAVEIALPREPSRFFRAGAGAALLLVLAGGIGLGASRHARRTHAIDSSSSDAARRDATMQRRVSEPEVVMLDPPAAGEPAAPSGPRPIAADARLGSELGARPTARPTPHGRDRGSRHAAKQQQQQQQQRSAHAVADRAPASAGAPAASASKQTHRAEDADSLDVE